MASRAAPNSVALMADAVDSNAAMPIRTKPNWPMVGRAATASTYSWSCSICAGVRLPSAAKATTT